MTAEKERTEMLPCPFCGNTDISRHEGLQTAHIECGDCGAQGPVVITQAKQSARSTWNCRAALQAESFYWNEPIERLKSPLSTYGLLVRALRIVANTTLMEMAKATGYTPAQLSAMEFGRNPPTDEMICFAHRFFYDKGLAAPLELFRQANARRIEGNHD